MMACRTASTAKQVSVKPVVQSATASRVWTVVVVFALLAHPRVPTVRRMAMKLASIVAGPYVHSAYRRAIHRILRSKIVNFQLSVRCYHQAVQVSTQFYLQFAETASTKRGK